MIYQIPSFTFISGTELLVTQELIVLLIFLLMVMGIPHHIQKSTSVFCKHELNMEFMLKTAELGWGSAQKKNINHWKCSTTCTFTSLWKGSEDILLSQRLPQLGTNSGSVVKGPLQTQLWGDCHQGCLPFPKLLLRWTTIICLSPRWAMDPMTL